MSTLVHVHMSSYGGGASGWRHNSFCG
jgi:hypothetical protein